MNKDTWNEKPDKIKVFDSLFTNNQIQIFKILLPYFEPGMQKSLAIYIKFMEFQYTLTYFEQYPNACMPKETIDTSEKIWNEILPFCSSSQKTQIEQLSKMFANMKNMQEMMDNVSMIKDMFPDGFSFENMGNQDGTMPDISQIFQMFGNSL